MWWNTPPSLILVVWGLVILYRGWKERRQAPLVLGTQLAAARARENQRVARTDVPASPMPEGRYASGEHPVINPIEVPRDGAIRELVARYAALDAPARAEMRYAISMDDIYQLYAFARRAAVFAIREHSPAWVESGLGAMAMMDVDRMDWRDVGMVFPLLNHAARRVNADRARLFEEAAAIAGDRMSELMRGFIPHRNRSLREEGYEEIATGFIDRGFDRYSPSRDLTAAILGIADVISADRFEVRSIEIADSFPDVWIVDSKALLKKVRGVATIHGDQILVFLAELPDQANAAALLERSRRPEQRRHPRVGIARGTLFCLVIASTFLADDPIDETYESMMRFEEPIGAILACH